VLEEDPHSATHVGEVPLVLHSKAGPGVEWRGSERLLLWSRGCERRGEGEGITSAREGEGETAAPLCVAARGGEVERERELPFIVRVWCGLMMGLEPFNQGGPSKGPAIYFPMGPLSTSIFRGGHCKSILRDMQF